MRSKRFESIKIHYNISTYTQIHKSDPTIYYLEINNIFSISPPKDTSNSHSSIAWASFLNCKATSHNMNNTISY